MTMPQMRAAFGGWQSKITMVKRVQSVANDGFVTYTDKQFTFRGTIQPLSPKEINLKPEGQRAFTWLQIHVITSDNSILNTNEQIKIKGQIYKIMGQNDYSLNGYMEYHVIKDYQTGNKTDG